MELETEVGESAALVPTWIGAVAAAAGVVVALLAIGFAYQQIRLTAIQMRNAAAREAQDSEERTRLYVSVDIVPSLAGRPAVDIIIKNHGTTTARNISVGLAGGLKFEAQSARDEIGPALGRLFAKGFDLAPGASRRVFWRFPDAHDASPRGDMGAPVAADLAISYGWQPGDDRDYRSYEDEYSYDLTEFLKLAPSPPTGSISSGSSSEAKNVANALRAVAANVGELHR